jgi:hypothetical protein
VKEGKFFTLAQFIAANPGKKLYSVDYLHAAFKLLQLPSDVALSFAKFFVPKFTVVDALIFLDEVFDLTKYQSYLSDGRTKEEAQFWLNLLEITGIFNDNLSEEEAVRLASSVVYIWNLKIAHEFSGSTSKARVIHDRAEGEVFVTIGQPQQEK